MSKNIKWLGIYFDKTHKNLTLNENHQLVKKVFANVCKILNDKNIDYYVVGGLSCYAITNTELSRYHNDIDFVIEEKCIPLLKEIFELTEFDFQDNRLKSTKVLSNNKSRPEGPHEVIAQHKYVNFHLGFYCFNRDENRAIIIRHYYREPKDNQIKVIEMASTSLLTKMQFDERPIMFNGVTAKMNTLEDIYNIKNNLQREKDVLDILLIESFVDKEKVEELYFYQNQVRSCENKIISISSKINNE